MKNTWLRTTTQMLRRSSIPMALIAVEANVELRWLYKFRDGYFNDPGVTKVQRIHDFLMKQGFTQGQESPEHGTESQPIEAGAVQCEHVPTHSAAA